MFKEIFTNKENDDKMKVYSLKSKLVTEMARPKKATPEVDENGQEIEQGDEDFKPSASSMTQTKDLFDDILTNMENKRDTPQFHAPLLTSKPGVGKTKRLQLMSKLLGIEMVTIEAPHIVEEHLINIPFIVFDPKTGSEHGGHDEVDTYHVELADSNLFSQLKKAQKIPDQEYLHSIYSGNNALKELFELYGGNETTIPDELQEIRDSYNVILFLDEYFRQTTDRIRNMLRGILNNKIGSHKIPKNVYVIYATNLAHEDNAGVEEEIPLFNQFAQKALKAPSHDEWFSWLVFNFEKDENVKLKKPLINKFYNLLKKNKIEMAHFDPAAEVATSPRRWEQLLLYINTSLPCKNEQDAKNLLSNVKLNFRNYLTGAHSEIVTKILTATAELIKETSNIDVSAHSVNAAADWNETLKHQIEARQKLGELRKYVPVLAGMPGIGKTAKAIELAHDMDLRFIDIDVSTINSEDVVGLPLPKKDKESGKFETEFSLPSLYQQIMELIHEKDHLYQMTLKKNHPEDWKEKWEEYEKRPLKYMIFLDEFNRCSPKVFNAMRRVVLEKNFGHGSEHGKLLTLPKEAIMIAAINPADAGAIELTSHMQDVVDVVDSAPTWKATMEYVKTVPLKKVEQSTMDSCIKIASLFVRKFETQDPDVPMEERPFHFEYGAKMWFSPREAVMMVQGMARSLQKKITEIRKKNLENLKADEMRKLEDDARRAIFRAMEEVLRFVFTKHGQSDPEEFFNVLEKWILSSDEIDIGEGIFYHKSETIKQMSLMDIIEEHWDAVNKKSMAETDDFINFMRNVDLTRFSEDLTNLALQKMQNEQDMHKYILDKNSPKKKLEGKKVTTDPNEKVSMLYNFILEVVFALRINRFDSAHVEAVYHSIMSGIRAYRKKMMPLTQTDPPQVSPDDLQAVAQQISELTTHLMDDDPGVID